MIQIKLNCFSRSSLICCLTSEPVQGEKTRPEDFEDGVSPGKSAQVKIVPI